MMKEPKDFQQILLRIRNAEDWRRGNYEEKWKKYIRMYGSINEAGCGRDSQIYVPYTFMMAETIRSRITESLFAEIPYVTVLPRDAGDAPGMADAGMGGMGLGIVPAAEPAQTNSDKAKKIQNLIDWQMNQRMRLPSVFSDELIPVFCQLGTAIALVTWRRSERTVKRSTMEDRQVMIPDPFFPEGMRPQMDELTGEPIVVPQPVVSTEQDVYYDDPEVICIDLFDFYTDPNSPSLESARYCGHREYMTRKEIEERIANAGWDVNWKKLTPESMDNQSGQEIRLNIGHIASATSDGYDRQEGVKDSDRGSLYTVHHYWEESRHVVILNGMQCVLDEPNLFWHGMKPYLRCCYTYLPNEFYGVGIPESVGVLQEELNTLRDQANQYRKKKIKVPTKVKRSSGLKQKDFDFREKDILYVNEQDDVEQMHIDDLPASVWQMEETIKADMRDATGCYDIIMGLTTSGETATTTMTRDNNAGIRFKNIVANLARDMMVPIAEMMYKLDQQFLTEDRVIRVIKDDPNNVFEEVTVSPMDLGGDADIMFVGSSTEPMASKELRKQQLIEAYNVAIGNPLYQQSPQAIINITRKLFEVLGLKDVESLLPQLPPMQPQAMPGMGGVPPDMGGMPLEAAAGNPNLLQGNGGANVPELQTMYNGLPELPMAGTGNVENRV
jgi:hypothetical protein